MAQPRPMNRMLLGDVGTGKTLVAAHALAAAADTRLAGSDDGPHRGARPAVRGQAGSAARPAGGFVGAADRVHPGCAARRRSSTDAASGGVSVLFGTHALLEESVAFSRLTLAIVDEQHRFGVNQRLGLRGKGTATDLLVMTATPIPRSLALTLYGDLATSYLRERPHAAAGVSTHLAHRRRLGQGARRSPPRSEGRAPGVRGMRACRGLQTVSRPRRRPARQTACATRSFPTCASDYSPAACVPPRRPK